MINALQHTPHVPESSYPEDSRTEALKDYDDGIISLWNDLECELGYQNVDIRSAISSVPPENLNPGHQVSYIRYTPTSHSKRGIESLVVFETYRIEGIAHHEIRYYRFHNGRLPCSVCASAVHQQCTVFGKDMANTFPPLPQAQRGQTYPNNCLRFSQYPALCMHILRCLREEIAWSLGVSDHKNLGALIDYTSTATPPAPRYPPAAKNRPAS